MGVGMEERRCRYEPRCVQTGQRYAFLPEFGFVWGFVGVGSGVERIIVFP